MELKLISLLGWFAMIATAWAISYNRKSVSLAHGDLGRRPAIYAGPADFENAVGRRAV